MLFQINHYYYTKNKNIITFIIPNEDVKLFNIENAKYLINEGGEPYKIIMYEWLKSSIDLPVKCIILIIDRPINKNEWVKLK